jgi:hypothetical protein
LWASEYSDRCPAAWLLARLLVRAERCSGFFCEEGLVFMETLPWEVEDVLLGDALPWAEEAVLD